MCRILIPRIKMEETSGKYGLTSGFSVSEHCFCPNHPAASRVAVCPSHFRQPSLRRLPLRDLVYGIWHWPGLHLPLLALTRFGRHSNSIRCRLRHQSYLGDLRLLLQLQVHQANWAHKGKKKKHSEIILSISMFLLF